METVLAAVAGGILAIAGGLIGARSGDRRARDQWRRDAQLQATTNLLSSLQVLMRRMINYAYLEDKAERRRDPTVAGYEEAGIAWNSAMYQAMLLTPGEAAAIIPLLDREVDRLLDLAASRRWTRNEFRQERLELGRLAASYLTTSRRLAGFPDLPIKSIWTWDVD
jgi:hypothetical protein